HLPIAGLQRRVSDWMPGRDPLAQASEDGLPALVGLSHGKCAASPGSPEALQPAVGDGEVRENELDVQAFEIAGRIDRSLRVWVTRIVECSNHVQQGIRIAQPGEMLGR